MSSPGADRRAAARNLPLSGLRVVEISTFVAAPLAGVTLAQLGAEVVRIDPIGGAPDHQRCPLTADGASLYWTGLNKAKQSLSVDFRSEEGRDLIQRLVAESGPSGGIVLSNAVGRSWLSADSLEQNRPDLIHLQIHGLSDGTPAVDYTVNAAVGYPLITGPQGHQDPVNHVLPAWDIACGLYAALGIASGERARRETGRDARSMANADEMKAPAVRLVRGTRCPTPVPRAFRRPEPCSRVWLRLVRAAAARVRRPAGRRTLRWAGTGLRRRPRRMRRGPPAPS